MSFLQRTLTVVFTLGDEQNPRNFKNTNSNTVTLSGLRVSAKILKAGFPQLGNAQIVIYGMTKSLMDQLSTLGVVVQLVPGLRNTVTVFAGDVASNPPGTVVFRGNIYAAWGDFSAEPEVPFYVEAQTAWAAANIPYPPSSFKGSSDIVTILGNLANAAGFNLENSGVSGIKLSNAYLYGSPLDQIRKVKKAISGQVEMFIDDDHPGGTLAIWPKNGTRNGMVPLISSSTGLVAYPNYNANGITLKTIFNPAIAFGKQIQVQSSLGDGKPNTAANGLWRVYGLNHDLESQVPNGQWFSEIQAVRFGQPFPVSS